MYRLVYAKFLIEFIELYVYTTYLSSYTHFISFILKTNAIDFLGVITSKYSSH